MKNSIILFKISLVDLLLIFSFLRSFAIGILLAHLMFAFMFVSYWQIITLIIIASIEITLKIRRKVKNK